MSSSSCSFSNSGSSSSSAIYTPADVKKISGDEAQIYDRQIRLWGLEAQNRLRNSAVLLVGMSGLGAEIAKNLMLSGLKALTLMDDQEVTNNTSSQFLIPPGSNGKNRAEASLDRVKVLNPMVEVSVDTGSVGTKPEQFFRDFDLVILVDQDYETANSVNKICRKQQTRFQAAGVFGWLGYAFFDFNNHTFLLPKPKEAIFENLDDDDEDKNGEGSSAKKARTDNSHCPVPTLTLEEEADTKVRKNVPFPSFEQTFGLKLGTKKMSRRRFTLPASYFVVRAFLRLMKEKKAVGDYTKEEAVAQWKQELEDVNLDENKQKFNADNFALFVKAPLNPVCAIVGSVLSQEAIKALSQNDVPLKNVFLYSALDSSGCICDVSA